MKVPFAIAVAAALTAWPAAAAINFGFVPNGPVTLNTPSISAGTNEATYPGAFVNIADVPAGIDLFEAVTLSGPFELINGAIDLTISVAGYDFWFNHAHRGAFTFTGSSGGAFAMSYDGPGVKASQSCDQTVFGGFINCSDTLVRLIPEPASVGLLGSALIGLAILLRRRRSA